MMKLFGFETIGSSERYMSRGWIGRLRLHIFHRGDNDPDCHDHPWSFWTLPLTSYVEEVRHADGQRQSRIVTAGRIHYRPAEFAHRVIGPISGRGKIVTLVWRSGKGREWGFWKDRLHEGCWVPWRQYVFEGGKDAPCGDTELTRAIAGEDQT